MQTQQFQNQDVHVRTIGVKKVTTLLNRKTVRQESSTFESSALRSLKQY